MNSTTSVNGSSCKTQQSERLRKLLTAVRQQRESWKIRALMAEAQSLEATSRIGNDGSGQIASNTRYVSLKRFLAKQFHPDYAPGKGTEKIVRNEIFKEIWGEIERLDEEFSAARTATMLQAAN